MKNLNLKCLNSFMNFLKFIKINDHPNGFEKAERSVGHFFFFLFQMSNSRTSSPIAYNGLQIAEGGALYHQTLIEKLNLI